MSDVQQALETIFSADSALYQQRGFQRRIGFGTRPALIHIDLANAWTRPGNAFSCDGMDTIIPGVQRLNEAARAKGIPIVYTTTAYAVTDGPNTDMGLWHHKIPVEVLKLGTDAVAIDERIAPEPGEHVIVKKHASAFFGTHLATCFAPRRRHGDHHGRDDGRLRPAHDRGCDRVRIPADRRAGVRRRPRRRRRRVEPVRHRREVRRRRAARDGARLPRRRRTAGRSSGGYRFSLTTTMFVLRETTQEVEVDRDGSAPDARPATNAEPPLHRTVLLPILPRRPDEHCEDDAGAEQSHHGKQDPERNGHGSDCSRSGIAANEPAAGPSQGRPELLGAVSPPVRSCARARRVLPGQRRRRTESPPR